MGKQKLRVSIIFSMAFLILISWKAGSAWSLTLKQWKTGEIPTVGQLMKEKKLYDDPAPIIKEGMNPKNYLPSDVYKKVTYDVQTMKSAWSEVVGFKSPDVTGKIAPDIKPGTYSYKDKEKYGFKELMIPYYYERFAPGASPYPGNFPEIKVVPTRQYYYSLPFSETTSDNAGKTKLDEAGYLVPGSYVAGIPFPKPSGKFKAQQLVYNQQMADYCRSVSGVFIDQGYNAKLNIDWEAAMEHWWLQVGGRVCEPKGCYDSRAKKQGEVAVAMMRWLSPQNSIGNAITTLWYLSPDKHSKNYLYFNTMRRVRRLSGEDTQDTFPGTDVIVDDGNQSFMQKLSPDRFPYEFKIIEEREYLVPTYTWDGSLYYTSGKGMELRNAEFERRPVYVIEAKQLDSNYIYSKRLLFFDKETFKFIYMENYDKKGRIYRTIDKIYAFHPEQGVLVWFKSMSLNHIDTHSTITHPYFDPFALWVKRSHVNIGTLMRLGK